MDKYLAELNRIVTEMEDICGLNLKTKDGRVYASVGIEELIEFCFSEAEKLPRETLKTLNSNIGKKTVLLSYVRERLDFYGKKKIDFSGIPCMGEVAKTLLPFTQKETITDAAFAQLDKCMLVLANLEAKDSMVRSKLAYRYLRIFVVLVAYNLACAASIVAGLILSQLIVR